MEISCLQNKARERAISFLLALNFNILVSKYRGAHEE